MSQFKCVSSFNDASNEVMRCLSTVNWKGLGRMRSLRASRCVLVRDVTAQGPLAECRSVVRGTGGLALLNCQELRNCTFRRILLWR